MQAVRDAYMTNPRIRRLLQWAGHQRPVLRVRARYLTPYDALLATYPRSGSTWMRFLLYESLSGQSADFDVVNTYTGRNARRVLPGGGRVVGTHDPYSRGDRKVVYLARDPRSVVISEYKLAKRQGSDQSFDEFFFAFLEGNTNPFGSWADHVRYWMTSVPARRGHLHLVKFEELRSKPEETLAQVTNFLGVSLDASTIEAVVRNNAVERMRAKEDVAPKDTFTRARSRDIRFVNEGATQGWQDQISPAQAALLLERTRTSLDLLGY
ncbi:MAG: sulfotransferase domain-containing protein [Actinobacteria bacterium]|nr:sulfotransferase domain-containing protein [Actinomycetota bacterium]